MQLFIKSLAGRTVVVDVDNRSYVWELKAKLQELDGIPGNLQQLLFGGRQIQEDSFLSDCGLGHGSTLQPVFRLRGGKGGFGALLRGAGRQAQTDNDDACRDLLGRRLRHVHADEKLAEWHAEAKTRELEKAALKQQKEEEKKARREQAVQVDEEAIKNEQKETVAAVATAMQFGWQEAQKLGKRKAEAAAPAKKPAKAPKFFGCLDDSEGSDSDEDASGYAVSPRPTPPASSGGNSQDSDQDLEPVVAGPVQGPAAAGRAEAGPSAGPTTAAAASAPAAAEVEESTQPVDLQQYESAAALEVLGMKRLQTELMGYGLKCGGSVAERATRLFLLKETPLAELDRKHFAKPGPKK